MMMTTTTTCCITRTTYLALTQGLSIYRIPYPYGSSMITARHHTCIRRPRYNQYPRGVPFAAMLRCLSCQVPKSNGGVSPSRGNSLTVWTKIHSQYCFGMSRDCCGASRDGPYSKDGLWLVDDPQNSFHRNCVALEVGTELSGELFFFYEK